MNADIAKASFSATQMRQWQVSDPTVSAWVVANAGSGKTHVLAQRVIRLLLSGANPASILCLTFTKAAAAEMARRIFRTLAAWVRMDDATLIAAISDLQGRAPDHDILPDARRLFARALETPGGLKIQTIHAFCERLLHQFPLEAGIPAHFDVLDETGERALLDAARRQVQAGVTADARLAESLRLLAETRNDAAIDDALSSLLAQRDRLAGWLASMSSQGGRGTVDDVIGDLARRLGLVPVQTPDQVLHQFFLGEPLRVADLWRKELLAALSARPAKNNDKCADLLRAMEHAPGRQARAKALFDFYLKSDGEPYKAGSRVSRAAASRFTDFDAAFQADSDRVLALKARWNQANTLQQTSALLTVADAVLSRYGALKNSRGALDFSDLVLRTRDLLLRPNAAAWVLYKLDSGLDHILVDEAQDTNPVQWRIAQTLAAEFFAGHGARTTNRTLFTVGDDKQSIYGFQGAEPRRLARMRKRFQDMVGASGQDFVTAPLSLSFRSTSEILDAVDKVFDGPLAECITSIRYQPHSAFRLQEPGRVVVWPRTVRESGNPPADWTTPYDAPAKADERLAQAIATEVKHLLQANRPLPSGKAVTPGQILVLTRRRDAFVTAINRALKRMGVETAGIDRIATADHIAVLDLLALADVMLMPADDLQLAACLKSPLFGFDDEDLLALAPRRRSSLWQALAKSTDARHQRAAARLASLRANSRSATPFRFFSDVLGRDGGRSAFRKRLGGEVDDVLDLFLSEVIAFEASGTPTLQGLVGYFRSGGGEVRRELDETAGAVRVMTVHGAKGLEADIVFLVDTGGLIQAPAHFDTVYPIFDRDHPGDPGGLVWRQRKADAPPAQQARQAEEAKSARDEYFRLLYVAMTRARDRLYVCGIRGARTPEDCWYATVRNALDPGGAALDGERGELLERMEWPAAPRPARTPLEAETPAPDVRISIPGWATRPVSPPPRIPQPLRPSAILAEAEAAVGVDSPFVSTDQAASRRRGLLIHALLQRLPDWPEGERASIADQILRRRGITERAMRSALAAEALTVIADPALQPIFHPGSRAEVEIAGLVPVSVGGHGLCSISGRVDRLRVENDRITIADFKTGAAPKNGEVPEHILRQLALYRRVLTGVYPDRPVSALLVWTREPRIEAVTAARMDQAISTLGIVTSTTP